VYILKVDDLLLTLACVFIELTYFNKHHLEMCLKVCNNIFGIGKIMDSV